MNDEVAPLTEKAPPGKKAEDWIKANKESFQKQYGDDWESVLYAKAWKLFGQTERSVFDKLKSTGMRMIFSTDYDLALDSLKSTIDRKLRGGKLNHTIEYYAHTIAKSYKNVDGYELADLFNRTYPNFSSQI